MLTVFLPCICVHNCYYRKVILVTQDGSAGYFITWKFIAACSLHTKHFWMALSFTHSAHDDTITLKAYILNTFRNVPNFTYNLQNSFIYSSNKNSLQFKNQNNTHKNHHKSGFTSKKGQQCNAHFVWVCSTFHSDLAWLHTAPVSYITQLQNSQHSVVYNLSNCHNLTLERNPSWIPSKKKIKTFPPPHTHPE